MTESTSDPLSAQDHPLRELFSDSYVFSIPSFQRPYSWGTLQARELLDDLTSYMGNTTKPVDTLAPYFLGSIVLIKRRTDPHAQVVDGQQRLTTLTLLFSAIRAAVDTLSTRDAITKRIYEQRDEVAGTEARYRLSLRSKDEDFFRRYVQHENGISQLIALNDTLPDAQDRLRANALLFMEALGQRDEAHLLRLCQFMVTRCYLVAVSTPDRESAFRIFGVLNSRGLDLTATDILKSEILGAITDEVARDRYTTVWEDLEDDLGRNEFGELFSHIRMIYRKSKPQGTLLKEFNEHVPTVPSESFMDTVLKPLARAYRAISDADYASQKHAEDVNQSLAWLNLIEFTDWLPPALVFFSRHSNDPDAMRLFFADLERLVYAMLIRRTGVNDRIMRCSELTAWIQDDRTLSADGSPLQLTPAEQYATYVALSGPLYATHSARALGVVLLRLDGLLSSGGASYVRDNLTVEHVLPQQPETISDWTRWIPEESDRLAWVNRLGNLALLSRKKNSSASNYDFEKKKTAYFTRNGVCPFAITTQVLQHHTWTLPVIEQRQAELLAVLETHWRLGDRVDQATVVSP